MSLDTALPLRDFDGESDDTDSETELLIRHHGSSSGKANDGHHHQLNTKQRSRHGSYSSYTQPHNTNRQMPSFLSQLFGVVGGTTTFSSSSTTSSFLQNQTKSKQTTTTPPSLLRSNSTSLTRDAQLRFRNERSRERRFATATNSSSNTSNITASQTKLNNAAQAARFGRSNSKSYNLNSSNDLIDITTGTNQPGAGSFYYRESLQMSDMDTSQQQQEQQQSNNNKTTTTSPNGVMQTVIDPENGSTTVFYQKNRRKSKKHSIGNLCKMCLCG